MASTVNMTSRKGTLENPYDPPDNIEYTGDRKSIMRALAGRALASSWPPDAACKAVLRELRSMVKKEGHLTWFLKYHFARERTGTCTHACRLSMGGGYGESVSAGMHIPDSEVMVVYALLFAMNHVGTYRERTYVTQVFNSTTKFKMHFEIDHVEGSATVLGESEMTNFTQFLADKYDCNVALFKSSRSGNRAHVFLNRHVTAFEMESARALADEWFRLNLGLADIGAHFVLDPATSKTRVIRAPFAKSPKAYRQDDYTPLLFCKPGQKAAKAEDMGFSIAHWIRTAMM